MTVYTERLTAIVSADIKDLTAKLAAARADVRATAQSIESERATVGIGFKKDQVPTFDKPKDIVISIVPKLDTIALKTQIDLANSIAKDIHVHIIPELDKVALDNKVLDAQKSIRPINVDVTTDGSNLKNVIDQITKDIKVSLPIDFSGSGSGRDGGGGSGSGRDGGGGSGGNHFGGNHNGGHDGGSGGFGRFFHGFGGEGNRRHGGGESGGGGLSSLFSGLFEGSGNESGSGGLGGSLTSLFRGKGSERSTFGRLLGGEKGGMFGLPGMGSLGAMGGLGPEHFLVSGAGLATSAATAAVGGGGALALGTAGKEIAGGVPDALVNKETISNVKGISSAMGALDTAVTGYGGSSKKATIAQANLNAALKNLYANVGPAAGGAEEALARHVNTLKNDFEKNSAQAQIYSTMIFGQIVTLAHKVMPSVIAAATTNLGIINKSIKPLFAYLGGPEVGTIMQNLENHFAIGLPKSISVMTSLTKMGLTVMDEAVNQSGDFMGKLQKRLEKDTTPAGLLHVRDVVDRLIGQFHKWMHLIGTLGGDLRLIFKNDVGTSNAIVDSLQHMLDKLHDWLETTRAKSQLKTLFTQHKKELLALLNLIPILVGAFGQVELAVGPSLTGTITDCVKLMVSLAVLLKDVPGGGMLLGLGLVASKLKVLNPLMDIGAKIAPKVASGIAKILAASLEAGGLTKMADAMKAMGAAMKAEKFAGLGTAIVEFAGAAGTAIAPMLGLDAVMNANPVGLIVLGFVALIAIITAAIAVIYELYKHFEDIKNFALGLLGISHGSKKAAHNVNKLNGGLKDQHKAVAVLTPAISQHQQALAALEPAQVAVTTAQQDLASSQDQSLPVIDRYKNAQAGLKAAQDDLTNATNGAVTAIQALGNQYYALTDSRIAVQQGIKDLTDVVGKNKAAWDNQNNTFDITTQAGQNLQTSFDNLTGSFAKTISNMQAAHDTQAQLDDYLNANTGPSSALGKLASLAGLSTAQYQSFLTSAGLIPSALNAVTAPVGVAGAQVNTLAGQVTVLGGAVKAMAGQPLDINTTAAQQQLIAFQIAIDSVKQPTPIQIAVDNTVGLAGVAAIKQDIGSIVAPQPTILGVNNKPAKNGIDELNGKLKTIFQPHPTKLDTVNSHGLAGIHEINSHLNRIMGQHSTNLLADSKSGMKTINSFAANLLIKDPPPVTVSVNVDTAMKNLTTLFGAIGSVENAKVAFGLGNIMAGHAASGTENAPPGWSWVGEFGPELMRMRGGEQVINATHSALIAAVVKNGKDSRNGLDNKSMNSNSDLFLSQSTKINNSNLLSSANKTQQKLIAPVINITVDARGNTDQASIIQMHKDAAESMLIPKLITALHAGVGQ